MKIDAVIFDLDGTIACTKDAYEGIDHPDLWSWDIFEKKMINAPVIDGIQKLWEMYQNHSIEIIVLTARPYFLRNMTNKYLSDNNFTNYKLIMMGAEWFKKQEKQRSKHDVSVIQSKFKEESVSLINDKYNILAAFDDSKQNVDMFRDNNITAFHLIR